MKTENFIIDVNVDIRKRSSQTLGITLMSQDINNYTFSLKIKQGGELLALDDSYEVEVLSLFTTSKTSRLVKGTIRTHQVEWVFDTSYISKSEAVKNYVYVRKDGVLLVLLVSSDTNCFIFNVGLSEIDKGTGKVAEVYDENYQRYLNEFKEVADFTVIQQAEAARESAETTRIGNEDARKSAEVIRLANEVERINAENVRSEFYDGFDGRLGDIEADKMVIKNMFTNGDFSNPTLPSISPIGTVLKISDGSLSSTSTSLSSSRGFYTSIDMSAVGDKIYCNLSVKPKHSTIARFGHSDSLWSPSITGGVWNAVSGVSIIGSTNAYIFYINTRAPGYVVGDADMFDNIVVINLTSTFGTGNEPSKAEMDELIKIIGYFDEITLTQMQLLNWQLKLMRQNRNALIALGGTII